MHSLVKLKCTSNYYFDLLQADLVAANLEAEQQPVLLVVTSQKLYFMRITVNQRYKIFRNEKLEQITIKLLLNNSQL